ncbi:helix-turn-helix domain-containing protein [Paenibacillus odorifer]|nr:helix-turn-helix transcriptional regulator [Paenibacillus odorifer]
MNPEKAFGITLKKYRGMVCLTQEALAYQCNLDRTYISLLERGLRRPTLNTIIVISESLNIKPSEIVQEVEQLLNENNKSEDTGK